MHKARSERVLRQSTLASTALREAGDVIQAACPDARTWNLVGHNSDRDDWGMSLKLLVVSIMREFFASWLYILRPRQGSCQGVASQTHESWNIAVKKPSQAVFSPNELLQLNTKNSPPYAPDVEAAAISNIVTIAVRRRTNVCKWIILDFEPIYQQYGRQARRLPQTAGATPITTLPAQERAQLGCPAEHKSI